MKQYYTLNEVKTVVSHFLQEEDSFTPEHHLKMRKKYLREYHLFHIAGSVADDRGYDNHTDAYENHLDHLSRAIKAHEVSYLQKTHSDPDIRKMFDNSNEVYFGDRRVKESKEDMKRNLDKGVHKKLLDRAEEVLSENERIDKDPKPRTLRGTRRMQNTDYMGGMKRR